MRLKLALLGFSLIVSAFSYAQSELDCPVPKAMPDSEHHLSSDFNSLSGWGKHFGYAHSVQIVSDPLNHLNRVVRFEIREGDVFRTRTGESNRAEIYERYRAPFDVGIHYKFKVLITDEWQFDNVRALIAQWHATPDRHLGEISRSPNLGIELRNNRFLIRSQTSDLAINHHNKNGMKRLKHYLSEKVRLNHWYQFDVQVLWTPSPNGYLKLKIDDETVVDFKGPTSYYDCVGPYFKAGVYRDDTPNSFVILFDDYYRNLLPN